LGIFFKGLAFSDGGWQQMPKKKNPPSNTNREVMAKYKNSTLQVCKQKQK